jgi:hypothetical protein
MFGTLICNCLCSNYTYLLGFHRGRNNLCHLVKLQKIESSLFISGYWHVGYIGVGGYLGHHVTGPFPDSFALISSVLELHVHKNVRLLANL